MTSKFIRKVICILLFLMILTSVQIAQATDIPVRVGRGVSYSGSVIPTVHSGDRLSVPVSYNNSYCCEVYSATNSEDSPRFKSLLLDNGVNMGGDPVEFWRKGGTDPALPFTGDVGDETAHAGRICFLVPYKLDGFQGTDMPLSIPFLAYVEMIFGIDGTGFASNVTATCEETTLNGGYNTSVTNYNFLELQNTTTSDLSVYVQLTDNKKMYPDYNLGPIIIGGSTRRDIDIHSIVGSGHFGSIRIMTQGPNGAIKARLSQYNIANGNPASFVPVGSEVLTPRPN